MRSLEPAATWTASTAAPRRGCQGGCLRVNFRHRRGSTHWPPTGHLVGVGRRRVAGARRLGLGLGLGHGQRLGAGLARHGQPAAPQWAGPLFLGRRQRDPLQHHRMAVRHHGDDGLQPIPRASATAGRLSRCGATQRQAAGAGRQPAWPPAFSCCRWRSQAHGPAMPPPACAPARRPSPVCARPENRSALPAQRCSR